MISKSDLAWWSQERCRTLIQRRSVSSVLQIWGVCIAPFTCGATLRTLPSHSLIQKLNFVPIFCHELIHVDSLPLNEARSRAHSIGRTRASLIIAGYYFPGNRNSQMTLHPVDPGCRRQAAIRTGVSWLVNPARPVQCNLLQRGSPTATLAPFLGFLAYCINGENATFGRSRRRRLGRPRYGCGRFRLASRTTTRQRGLHYWSPWESFSRC